MAALPIPACGFSVGTDARRLTGLTTKTSMSGLLKGWKTWTASKDELTLVFAMCTNAERSSLKSFFDTNLVVGGVTFTHVDGTSKTVQFLEDGYKETPTQSLYWSVTLRVRET